MKATDLLKKDHAAVKKLFADFDKTGERALTDFRQLRLATAVISQTWSAPTGVWRGFVKKCGNEIRRRPLRYAGSQHGLR